MICTFSTIVTALGEYQSSALSGSMPTSLANCSRYFLLFSFENQKFSMNTVRREVERRGEERGERERG